MPVAGRHMSGALSYRPAKDRLIIYACSRSRIRPVRDWILDAAAAGVAVIDIDIPEHEGA